MGAIGNVGKLRTDENAVVVCCGLKLLMMRLMWELLWMCEAHVVLVCEGVGERSSCCVRDAS